MGGNLVKHFNVMMAALISGTVALFTSVLGVSGTIIGSVLSSFLYQLLTGYSEEKYEEGSIRKPKLANEIVYIFPLVVIGIIELIFLLSALHYRFDMIFSFLESAVANNLFRLMGIGLIILGAYPYFNSNNIAKKNGTVVLIVGVLLLLRGLMDVSDISSKIFYAIFAEFDMLFASFVVIALALVILNILIGSKRDIIKSNEFINSYRPRKPHARKIDTSFAKNGVNVGSKDKSHDSYPKNDYYKVPIHDSNHNLNSHNQNQNQKDMAQNGSFNPNPQTFNQEDTHPPIYEEEVILVNNPKDPENPIRKRILKRIKLGKGVDNDDYQDMYIIDEPQ